MTRAISTDPCITARVLRLVNSAYWGFGGRIDSVSRAIALLGMLHVHDVVLARQWQLLKGIAPARMDVPRFWRHSVFRALAANALARQSGRLDMERLFVEGLLSDIGHMMLYQHVPELAAQALQLSHEQPAELPRLERELIGCDYAEVGAALVQAWGLASCFQAVIRHQNYPELAQPYATEAALVHIARLLAIREFGTGPEAENVKIPAVAWQLAGLDEDARAKVLAEARSSFMQELRRFGGLADPIRHCIDEIRHCCRIPFTVAGNYRAESVGTGSREKYQ